MMGGLPLEWLPARKLMGGSLNTSATLMVAGLSIGGMGGSGLQNATFVQDHDVAAQHQGFAGFGGGVDDDGLALPENFLELHPQLFPKLVVQVDQGFVHQQQVGIFYHARAMAVRCCWPPESSAGRRSRRSSIRSISAISRTWRSISDVEAPLVFKRRRNVLIHRERRIVDEQSDRPWPRCVCVPRRR